MGKFERRDSKKVLAGKQILLIKPRSTLLDVLLMPYRAWKQKRREAEIRKNLFKD